MKNSAMIGRFLYLSSLSFAMSDMNCMFDIVLEVKDIRLKGKPTYGGGKNR